VKRDGTEALDWIAPIPRLGFTDGFKMAVKKTNGRAQRNHKMAMDNDQLREDIGSTGETQNENPKNTGRSDGKPPLPLQPKHLDELQGSGLAEMTIHEAGIYSITEPQANQLLQRNDIRGGGYALPYFNLDGTSLQKKDGQPYANIKLDTPLQDRKGKPKKYLKPTGEPNYLYAPPQALHGINDSALPLLFTEGEKKALKAAQEGYMCVALPGVWGFKTRKGQKGGRSIPLPQLDAIPMSQRVIFIVFDSDAAHNPKVQKAEKALAEYTQNRGATVHVLRLPSGTDGEKVGLDDFLIQQGADGLIHLMEKARTATDSRDDGAPISQKSSIPPAADLADNFLTDEGLISPKGLLLRWHREERLKYNGKIFESLPQHDLKSWVMRYLCSSAVRKKATPYLVKSVMEHLEAICIIPSKN